MKLVAAVLLTVLTLGCSLSARFEQKPSELRFLISSARLNPDGRFCIITTNQQTYCVNSLRDQNGDHRVYVRIDESIVGTTAVITPSDNIYASRILIFVTSQEAYKEYQSQIDTVDTKLYKPRKDAPLTVGADN